MSASKERPTLTKESLEAARKPSNGCSVRRFLDGLTEQSRETLEYGLSLGRDFPAPKLRGWLVANGYQSEEIPTVDAIQSHRNRRSPCKCN